jgi:hypothetical protein
MSDDPINGAGWVLWKVVETAAGLFHVFFNVTTKVVKWILIR